MKDIQFFLERVSKLCFSKVEITDSGLKLSIVHVSLIRKVIFSSCHRPFDYLFYFLVWLFFLMAVNKIWLDILSFPLSVWASPFISLVILIALPSVVYRWRHPNLKIAVTEKGKEIFLGNFNLTEKYGSDWEMTVDRRLQTHGRIWIKTKQREFKIDNISLDDVSRIEEKLKDYEF